MFSELKDKILSPLLGPLNKLRSEVADVQAEIESLKILAGIPLIEKNNSRGAIKSLSEVEFKIFSQFGDDGIIQYLVHSLGLSKSTFIEFGVEDYSESNTRFLLQHNNWKGLVLDGSEKNISHIRKQGYFWRHDLTAVAAFINKDNINDLFVKNGFKGEIGLLSIDIDGNDYWVWEKVEAVSPALVVIEYNSIFGAEAAVTVPYDPAFIRSKAHYSCLYWGASVAALKQLGEKKGYLFAGRNSAGNNAYFIKKDKMGGLRLPTLQEGYVESAFRESRDRNGNLNFLSGNDRLREIRDCMITDVSTNVTTSIRKCFKLD